MATYRTAALCAGYGGLEMGLALAGVDHELAWYAEIDMHASAVMAYHNPGAPNLGDLTQITDPPEVDIVTAGFPCQPVSGAGLRKGTEDERWIIDDVVSIWQRCGARWLILENVSGLLSANNGEAFGRVVDAIAKVGGTARWTHLRASDVGACHRRERWFCIASTADADGIGLERTGPAWYGWPGFTNGDLGDVVTLPTPTASQPGGTAELHLERKRGGKMNRAHPTVTDLRMALEMLPTPQATNNEDQTSERYVINLGQAVGAKITGTALPDKPTPGWSRYEPAIERHVNVLGRPAPSPLVDGKLSPLFVEWMMGLPEGHVTDVIDRRPAALKILGNGVVPLQAATAVTELLAH